MADGSITPRNSLYGTINEAELSEYLVYITCPICEEVRVLPASMRCHTTPHRAAHDLLARSASSHSAERAILRRAPCANLTPQVVSKDPVFTLCNHTFCGDCIRQHILAGNDSCPECARPVQLNQLQPNSMALNLLNNLKVRGRRRAGLHRS